MSYNSFAGVYDLLTENAQYDRRTDCFCSLLSENGIDGGLLLDLACGTGSFSTRFADRGFSVIGVDCSEEMLSVAHNKLAEKPQDILYLCQDMRSLDLYGTVDCCVCALDSLNHLESEEDLLCAFQNVSLFLNDSGIFIFDMNTVYKHRSILSGETFVYDCPPVYCVWQNSEVRDGDVIDINLDIFEDDGEGNYQRSCESFSEKAYGIDTVKALLEKAELDFVACYDELSREEPKENSQRIIFVAKRKDRK